MPQQLSSRIAIVVPVFNTAKYLSECLDSIRAQTYSNFSVFLIDDGSTDDSPSICDRYANQDDRFHVLHKINGGVSTARNAALELIERKGGFDWIICLDSDDYLSNDALEMVSTRGAQLKADMLVFGVQRFSKDGFQVDGKKSHTTLILNCQDAFRFSFDQMPESRLSPAFSYFIGNIAFSADLIRGIRS